MKPVKFYICAAYRIIFLSLCGYGILLHFSLYDAGTNEKMFCYFTVQSNILCFITFLCITLKMFSDEKLPGHNILIFFKGMSTVSIIVTFVIFHFFVAVFKFDFFSGGTYDLSTKTLFAHYIVPILVVMDWLIFQEKGLYDFKSALEWLVFPLIYFLVIMLRPVINIGAGFSESSKYPYFFMDLDRLGIMRCALYTLFFTIFIIAVGYMIVFIDKLLAQMQSR